MESDARAMFERARCMLQQLKVHIGVTGHGHGIGARQCFSARDVRNFHAGEIHRDSLARDGFFLRLAMYLKPADLHRAPGRLQLELIVGSETSDEERSGDDRTESFQREDTVDRQPRWPLRPPWSCRGGKVGKGSPQLG